MQYSKTPPTKPGFYRLKLIGGFYDVGELISEDDAADVEDGMNWRFCGGSVSKTESLVETGALFGPEILFEDEPEPSGWAEKIAASPNSLPNFGGPPFDPVTFAMNVNAEAARRRQAEPVLPNWGWGHRIPFDVAADAKRKERQLFERAALAAMQGLLACPGSESFGIDQTVEDAVNHAKEFVKVMSQSKADA